MPLLARCSLFLSLCVYLQLSATPPQTGWSLCSSPYRPYEAHAFIISDCKWQLSDPSKKNLSLHCSVPQNTPNTMHYLGCSYGYLIFSYEEHCLLVNVLTGTNVKPPKLPSNNKLGYFCGIGVLTAAFSSTNSRLLLCSETSMFEWQVGTDSWSVHPLTLGRELIHQILSLNGDMFVIDGLRRLHKLHLAPGFSMQEVPMVWESLPTNPWLVVSGDKLLMVDLSFIYDELNGSSSIFEVFHLDFSVEPAKWVEIEKLENQALFVLALIREILHILARALRDGEERVTAFMFPSYSLILMKLGLRSNLVGQCKRTYLTAYYMVSHSLLTAVD